MITIFNNIIIENFKTFVGKPVRFNLTSKYPGLVFICGRNEDEPDLGSNGAAKSSIFDALCWCLYGRTIDNLRAGDVTPWEYDGNPYVSVTILIDEKKNTIERSTNPNRLLINGEEADQDAVDHLIGITFEVFRHTVLLGQNQGLFFDLAPKDKMAVFATALGLDRWETRSELASEGAKNLDKELVTLRSNLNATENTLDEIDQLMAQAKSRASEWDAIRKNRSKELEEERIELTKKLKQLQKRQIDADLIRDSAGTELKALEADIAKRVKARDAAQAAYNRVDLALEGLEDVVSTLRTELKNLGEGDNCPTCGQTLKGTALAKHKADLKERIQDLQGKIKKGVPKELTYALEKAVSALEAANTHAETFRERAEAAQTTLNVVTPEVVRTESKIKELQSKQTERDEEINPHRVEIQNLRKRISQREAQLEDLDKKILTTERLAERTRFWVKGFKDVRLHMLEEMLQELELATNALLPESGLHDWEINYSIEKETKKGTVTPGLNLTVLSPHNKKPVKWECWSGGEGHRLRVVGALALAEVLLSHAGVQTNLEILDEPTKDLSVEGVQDLVEYLANRAKALDKDIFLIDHLARESTHFSRVITVVKTAEGSHFE